MVPNQQTQFVSSEESRAVANSHSNAVPAPINMEHLMKSMTAASNISQGTSVPNYGNVMSPSTSTGFNAMRIVALLGQLQKMNNLNLSSDVVFEMLQKLKNTSEAAKKNSNTPATTE